METRHILLQWTAILHPCGTQCQSIFSYCEWWNYFVFSTVAPRSLVVPLRQTVFHLICRLTVRASCVMDLRNLPLDTQRCALLIGSFAYDSEETIYEWNKVKSVDVQSDLIMNQFSLINTSVGSQMLVRDNRKFSWLLPLIDHLTNRMTNDT